jgi:hypothetical protein
VTSAPSRIRFKPAFTTTGGIFSRSGNRILSKSPAAGRYFNKYLTTPPFPTGRRSRHHQSTKTSSRKFDQTFNDRHRAFFRYSLNDNRLTEPGSTPALGTADSGTRGQNYTASITSNLKPSLLNEFRFNTLYGAIHLAPYLPGIDFNKEAKITGLENLRRSFDTGSFPDFAWSGYAGINGSFDQRPKTQDRYTLEFTDNLTWIKGRHVVKAGMKMRHYQWLGTDSKNYMGNWTFNGQNTENPASAARTGDSIADWVLGLPANAGRGFPSDTFGGAYTAWQVFVQDDFKVSSRLTLNIGLRYEYTPWTTGYRGQTGTFDGTQSRPIIVASKTNQVDLGAQPAAPIAYGYLKDLIQTSSEAGLPYSITYPDKRQIAPRFGFAWRPVGETTVLRGGYGIFYEGEYTDGRVNLFMPPFLLQDSALNDRGVIPNRTLADFYLGAPLGSPNSTIGLTPEYTHMRMGYDQHWNVGIQQQLSKVMVADIEYVGNKGSNIQGSDGFNIPAPAAGGVQARRQFPRFGAFSYISSDISSTYHAMQFKLERRLSAGLWLLGSYTFSKSLWNTNTPAVGGMFAFEKGPSEYQVPHSFSFSFGYELPFGKGKPVFGNANRLANGVIGGWHVMWQTRVSADSAPTA